MLKNDFTKQAFVNVVGTVIGGLIMSLCFFVWSDYVVKEPNLNGRWYFTIIYEDVQLSKLKNLQVTYEVLLSQENLHIKGTGERIEEVQSGVKHQYIGEQRVPIDIEGTIDFNYFANDTLNIRYNEFGKQRRSASFHKLIRFDDTRMDGTFDSTISDSSGRVFWSRKR
jgi:hypothetical protein